MSKSKLNITLDEREKINPKDIDGDGKPDAMDYDGLFDGEGYEKEPAKSRKELKFKKKEKWISIKLNLIGDGLRLVERFLNKYAGFLIGNNENPLPSITVTKIHVVYWVIITVLIITLWIR